MFKAYFLQSHISYSRLGPIPMKPGGGGYGRVVARECFGRAELRIRQF